MIRVVARRRPASDAEVEAAIAAIELRPGIYFGTDRGVAGLHALGAVLIDAPSLRFRVRAAGVSVAALDAFGTALLGSDALQACRARLGDRGAPIEMLRAFLGAFEPAADVRLVGALPFHAHRLAGATAFGEADEPEPDGFLLFARTFLERSATGAWQRVELDADSGIAARTKAAGDGSDPGFATVEVDARPTFEAARATASDDFAPGGYAEVLGRAVERLRSAPLVSLTLSQSFRRVLPAGTSAAHAFAKLRAVNPAPATFFFRTDAGERVFGASPDLQLVVAGRTVESLPVCGTVARGDGAVGEAEALRELFAGEVDAASLAVCSDALRNDLAPLCEPGSLRLVDRSRPMSLATVVHAVDRLQGRLRDGCDAWDAIVATAAPPMLVGAPRRLALEAIAAHEASPRRWYGGLVVEVRGDGDARVGTLLRAASLRDGIAEVRTGGDLLADSDPAREAHESRIKAVSLWRALGFDDTLSAIETAVETAIEKVIVASVPGRYRPAEPTPGAVATVGATPRAVALACGDDAFAASLADSLAALGIAIDPGCEVQVVSGGDAEAARALHAGRSVAVGDTAYALLRHHGVAVEAMPPENGRLARAVAQPPLHGIVPRSFFVGRYDRHRIATEGPLPAEWQVWLRDARDGVPLALAHAPSRSVCLAFRPDSTLGDPLGLAVLRHALGYAAT